jgi:transposase
MTSIDPTSERELEGLSKPALITIIRAMAAKIASLEQQMAQLQEQVARLSKDSSTSSKPPSSDIVKPPKAKSNNTGKPGGQKGHPGFWRKLFLTDRVDEIQEHRLFQCPSCKFPLEAEHETEPWIHQIAELPEKLTHVTEHRRCGYLCPGCHQQLYAPLPGGIEGEIFGPRLQSLVVYMKAALHGSYTTLEEFMAEVFKLQVSRSGLANQIKTISPALEVPYQELQDALADQPSLHIDETGHKDNGHRYWIWAFCTKLFGFFTVEASRGSQVLKKVLGETFKGTLVSDFFSAYVKYASSLQQFCLAHLIRDVKFLTTLPDPANQQFGIRLLRQFKRLFYFWHLRHTMPQGKYSQAISVIVRNLRALVSEKQLPRKSQNIANRLDKHWSSYLRFLADPSIAPTNNLAEQTIRTVVIDRKITQGTRSEWGRRWSERIWTVLATCRKQKRSSWKFIQNCVLAQRLGTPYPSLIPAI